MGDITGANGVDGSADTALGLIAKSLGNDELKEFTVIGDVVNVANRVCDAGKELKSDFVITEELRLRLNEEIKSEVVENFAIRGKKEKLKLHIVNI